MPKGVYFPSVLLVEPRFVELSLANQHLIIRLYFIADPWGRLSGSPRVIAQETWHDEAFVSGVLPSLLEGPVPFAFSYEAGGAPYLQLNQYDQHMERTFIATRSRPKHPNPPRDVFERAGSVTDCRRPEDTPPYREDPDETAPSSHWDGGEMAVPVRKEKKESETNNTQQNPTDVGVWSGEGEGVQDPTPDDDEHIPILD